MQKYVFFLDIDGTLFNDGVVCRKNRQALAQARRLGHLVFINTARSYSIIPQKILKMKFDGYVTSMGCSIIVGGKKIYTARMPIEETAEIFDYFNNTGRTVHLEGDNIFLTNREENRDEMIFVSSGAEIIKRFSSENIPKFFIPGVLSADEIKRLSERYCFYQHENYAEFCVRGNTKATGIQRTMQYLGMDIKFSVAAGDSINDIEMLRAAGIAVVMGDAENKVKEYADIVTCAASAGGVAEGIYGVIGLKPKS